MATVEERVKAMTAKVLGVPVEEIKNEHDFAADLELSGGDISLHSAASDSA